MVNIRISRLKSTGIYIKSIISIGFPSAVQYALTVVAVAAQSKFVSQYDVEAVAALGIVKKLDQLPLYFSIGTANGLGLSLRMCDFSVFRPDLSGGF